MFTKMRCILCFLIRRLRCRCGDLGLIFLCQHLRRNRQFLRPVVATQQPPPSSSNLRSLRHIVYSLSLANISVVVNYVGQAVKEYLPLGCWLLIFSGGNLPLWLLGAVFYLTLLDTATLKKVVLKTEYLDYFTRNIQSFGLSLICVVRKITRQGRDILS